MSKEERAVIQKQGDNIAVAFLGKRHSSGTAKTPEKPKEK